MTNFLPGTVVILLINVVMYTLSVGTMTNDRHDIMGRNQPPPIINGRSMEHRPWWRTGWWIHNGSNKNIDDDKDDEDEDEDEVYGKGDALPYPGGIPTKGMSESRGRRRYKFNYQS